MTSTPSPAPRIAVSRTLSGTLSVPGATIDVLGEALPTPAALAEFARGASILVTMYTDRVDAALLAAAGAGLMGVCNVAVGVNNIDLDACRSAGVIVTNTPDAVTEGTADLAWALVLAVARRLIEADRYARSAAYPARGPLGMAEMLGQDLTGRTLHIVGAGRIGLAVAHRARAWGMSILYTARSRHWEFELSPLAAERVELDAGLARADVVSIHTPLTPATHHLIDARRLGLLKPSAILINTSRGPVIDEAALAARLHAGALWGAGLDVYEREPVIHPDLLTAPNTVLTPHIGSAAARYREEMTAMVAANAAAILRGEQPPNQVN
ncbi:MAG: D-glycerate dehydrogenase [Phycisphaeraceae bacterium]|nr:D-glycerate dehydrogenase [Phycisphaeraceae bacterium]MCW5762232.1 D-glycerate dehydrogenase [Phycisphaeraceae bacterium]